MSTSHGLVVEVLSFDAQQYGYIKIWSMVVKEKVRSPSFLRSVRFQLADEGERTKKDVPLSSTRSANLPAWSWYQMQALDCRSSAATAWAEVPWAPNQAGHGRHSTPRSKALYKADEMTPTWFCWTNLAAHRWCCLESISCQIFLESTPRWPCLFAHAVLYYIPEPYHRDARNIGTLLHCYFAKLGDSIAKYWLNMLKSKNNVPSRPSLCFPSQALRPPSSLLLWHAHASNPATLKFWGMPQSCLCLADSQVYPNI